MEREQEISCTAFAGFEQIASGDLAFVALKAKEAMDRPGAAPVLIFDDVTGETVEVDFRGTEDDLLKRLAVAPVEPDRDVSRGPGRPKLGVVAREVTLLPRHWDWLNSQPGGASVALRKLVEGARRANEGRDRVRQSQEAAYRFMSALAGNLPGFEEAARALFAGERSRFDDRVAAWPADVRSRARKLSAGAFEGKAGSGGGGV
jgi:hypothetical protein